VTVVILWSSLTEPQRSQYHGVVNLIDMYPTLVEFCGLPKNPKLDGRSFAPLLRDPNMTWNHPTLTNGYSPGFCGVYDGLYSYISNQRRGVMHGKHVYSVCNGSVITTAAARSWLLVRPGTWHLRHCDGKRMRPAN
jgi:arylsulfatase A-like enzyme